MKNNKYGLTVTSIRKYGFKKAVEIWEKCDKKCSVCGAEDRLAVHHIDESGNTDHRNDEVDNLQLMCASCHMSYHNNQRWSKRPEKLGGYLVKGRRKEYYREWSQKNRESRKIYLKEYRKKYYILNKEKITKQNKENLRKRVESKYQREGEQMACKKKIFF